METLRTKIPTKMPTTMPPNRVKPETRSKSLRSQEKTRAQRIPEVCWEFD